MDTNTETDSEDAGRRCSPTLEQQLRSIRNRRLEAVLLPQPVAAAIGAAVATLTASIGPRRFSVTELLSLFQASEQEEPPKRADAADAVAIMQRAEVNRYSVYLAETRAERPRTFRSDAAVWTVDDLRMLGVPPPMVQTVEAAEAEFYVRQERRRCRALGSPVRRADRSPVVRKVAKTAQQIAKEEKKKQEEEDRERERRVLTAMQGMFRGFVRQRAPVEEGPARSAATKPMFPAFVRKSYSQYDGIFEAFSYRLGMSTEQLCPGWSAPLGNCDSPDVPLQSVLAQRDDASADTRRDELRALWREKRVGMKLNTVGASPPVELVAFVDEDMPWIPQFCGSHAAAQAGVCAVWPLGETMPGGDDIEYLSAASEGSASDLDGDSLGAESDYSEECSTEASFAVSDASDGIPDVSRTESRELPKISVSGPLAQDGIATVSAAAFFPADSRQRPRRSDQSSGEAERPSVSLCYSQFQALYGGKQAGDAAAVAPEPLVAKPTKRLSSEDLKILLSLVHCSSQSVLSLVTQFREKRQDYTRASVERRLRECSVRTRGHWVVRDAVLDEFNLSELKSVRPPEPKSDAKRPRVSRNSTPSRCAAATSPLRQQQLL